MFGERYILDIIEGKRSSYILKPILFLLSRLYRFALQLRHKAYDQRWMKVHSVKVPVISVGNIAVGGTGKTPLVQLLVDTLDGAGKIAVLTRGFRSAAAKKKVPLLLVKGSSLSARECGDEPLLLAERTSASIWVGPNRWVSAQCAIDKGASCLILDDGLQHRQLHRDYEIVTIDALDPFSQHRFLPYGRLRDLPERLAVADLIVANHTKNLNHYREVEKALSVYTRSPVVGMQHRMIGASHLQGTCLGVFCGIAQPKYFLESLRALGANVAATSLLLDHQEITEGQLRAFALLCMDKGATTIVCTEKDWIKLPKSGVSLPLPLEPIKMYLHILAGQEHWDRLINNIKDRI